MNRVFFIGNLGKDPDIRTTQAGKMVTQFSLGVADGFGQNKTTTWLTVICWEKLAESAGNNLNKGSKVLVEGRLQIRSFDGKDGQKRYATEIVASHIEYLSPKAQSQQATDNSDPASQFGQDVAPDDEIPF